MRLHLLVGAKMASVQAAPKHGLRRYGVPPGGPWDRESAWVANALLGNPLDAPVLEWALSALEFEMEGDEGLSVVGARRPFIASRHRVDSAGGTPAVQGSPLLRPGDPAIGSNGGGGEGLGERSWRESPSGDAGKLPAVRWVPVGARGYLALSGGVFERSEGEVMAGSAGANGKVLIYESTESLRDRSIRVTPGPQASQFDLSDFARASFKVDPQSNRIGIRLSGPTRDPGKDITSEPACHGSVQIDNSGQPIILGPDGPTIGGYPKIAVVCEADLDRLAQLRPGDAVRFEVVSIEQAQELRREWQKKIRWWLAQIAAVREANAHRPS